MRWLLKRLGWLLGWSAIAVAVFLAFSAREKSPSFQQCKTEHAEEDASKQVKERPSGFFVFIRRDVIAFRCTGRFLDANPESIAALGTLVIAIFTVTLWQSTSRQARQTRESIELATREFIATHRPHMTVFRVKPMLSQLKNRETEVGMVEVEFVNSGASTAKIFEINGTTVTLAKLDEGDIAMPPPHKSTAEIGSGNRIGFNFARDPTVFAWHQLLHHRGHQVGQTPQIYAIGYIRYGPSVGDSVYETGFCRKMEVSSGRWIDSDFPEYEYSY